MRTVTAAFLMAAALAVGRAAVAQDAPAQNPTPVPAASALEPIPPLVPLPSTVRQPEQGRREGGLLPRLDPKREDKAFAAELAAVQRVHRAGDCVQAYARYLTLAQRRPYHPDVLWGLGECGAASAPELTNPAARRDRLTYAKAMYEYYAEVEQRSKPTKGRESRVALARARAAEIEAQIAAIVVLEVTAPVAIAPAASGPAAASAPPPEPIPVAAAPAAAPLPEATVPGPPAIAESAPVAAARAAPLDQSAVSDVADRLADADAFARDGKLREAVIKVEALLAEFPDDLLFQERVVVWFAMLGECQRALERYERIHLAYVRADVHEAAASCAEEVRAPSILLHALEGYAHTVSYVEPTVYADLGEIYAAIGETEKAKAAYERYVAFEHRSKYAARREEVEGLLADLAAGAPAGHRHVTSEEHLKCLISRGFVIAQFVNEGGKLVMQLRPPPNWRNIPCTMAKK